MRIKNGVLLRFLGLGGKRGHADSTADCGHANKKIPYVYAFSTYWKTQTP